MVQKPEVDICRTAGVQSVFQQKTTLRGLLTRVKWLQRHMNKGVVYPRAQCDKRSTTVKQEDPWLMYGMPVLTYEWTQHGLGGRICGQIKQVEGERKTKESMHIRTRKTYNLDLGSSLSPVWNPLLDILGEVDSIDMWFVTHDIISHFTPPH